MRVKEFKKGIMPDGVAAKMRKMAQGVGAPKQTAEEESTTTWEEAKGPKLITEAAMLDACRTKAKVKFIKVDADGIYHYLIKYQELIVNFDLAPEFVDAVKDMALHFIKDVKGRNYPSSVVSNPNHRLNTLDEAIANLSPANDPQVGGFWQRLWSRRPWGR